MSENITAKSPRKKDKKVDKQDKNKVVEEKAPSLNLSLTPIQTSGALTKHQISLKECELMQVTVFSDRSEMTRKVSLTLPEGENEICVSGIFR